MKNLLLSLLILCSASISGQDTIRLMHYNLLNFGAVTESCTFENNNPDSKTIWLKTIIDHFLPDLFTVNEISPNTLYHNMILNNALNSSGRNYYQKTQPTNFAGSTIINMLYYNTLKVGLAKQEVIFSNPRDINVYKFYHKSPYLSQGGDTTYFYCGVAHLKAGNTTTDQQQRATAAQAVINYLQDKNITDPFLFAGDLNLYTSAEPAWTTLTGGSGDFRFSDALNMAGNWSGNASFASVHTQSTHTESACVVGSGMDDRFDFILTNPSATAANSLVKYLPGSYITAGQDGLRFQGSLINPPNNSLPAPIIEALYNLSDHLPVMVSVVARTLQPQFIPDLFFSEYVEGSGNNKALEIFNPASYPVDLSGYRLERYVNGSTNADTISLSGMLDPGRTYVVVIDKRDPNGSGANVPVHPDLMAVADTFLCPDATINQTMYFNGNDAMALRKKSGQLVDLIGKIGQNPGLGWTDDSLCTAGAFTTLCGATAWTTNHTMVRKFGVTKGVKANPLYFDVTLQWDTLSNDIFDSLGFHRSITNYQPPQSWNFSPTMISHILTIPTDAIITLESQPALPGAFIGVFYRDGSLEKCAGNVQWFGNQNIALVAYGDDFLTPEKDGFAAGETIVWKILNPSDGREYDATASYSAIWPQNNGIIAPGGISAITSLNGLEILTQLLDLPAGWSGVSLSLDARWPLLEDIFKQEISKVIYMTDGNLVYYPEQNINQIIEWKDVGAYYIKVEDEMALRVAGYSPQSRTIQLNAGWNLMPVMSDCNVPVTELVTSLGNNLLQIKEVAGVKVFWPEKSIQTLNELLPGKSYFILVNEGGNFTFLGCE